jgi:hypothetical protein
MFALNQLFVIAGQARAGRAHSAWKKNMRGNMTSLIECLEEMIQHNKDSREPFEVILTHNDIKRIVDLEKRHAELVELVENWKKAKINNEGWKHTFGAEPKLCDIEAGRGNEFYKKFKQAETALREFVGEET